MEEVTSQWLEETVKEFRESGITDGQIKSHEAVKKWRKETAVKLSLVLDFEGAMRHQYAQIDKIKSFFLTQSDKDRGYIDVAFVGIFYYAGSFWEFVVPRLVGARSGIRILDQLNMAKEIRQYFNKDKDGLNKYISVWEDAQDYCYGIDWVKNICPNDFSKELFRSGDKHLRSAISLLNQEKASAKSIEDARMSVEIFLKAFLSIKENLTDKDLKVNYSHFFEKTIIKKRVYLGLFESSISHGLTELSPIKSRISIFPPVESRYEATEPTLGEMWTAYSLALETGATVFRDLTGISTKGTIKRQ